MAEKKDENGGKHTQKEQTMSDTSSQLIEESTKLSSAMLEIVKDIKKLATRLPQWQGKILIEDENNIVMDRIRSLDDSEKIFAQIFLCCAIKPRIFNISTRDRRYIYKPLTRSLATSLYINFYNNLAEHFSYYNHNPSIPSRNLNFFKFASEREQKLFQDTLDRLLEGVYTNLRSAKKSDEDIEMYIKDANKILSFVIDAANARAKDAENLRDLKEEAGFFGKRADKYKTNSRWFLWGALAFLLLIIISSIVYFCLSGEMLSDIAAKGKVSKSFYFYLALKILVSGRVIVSVIFIAGFFSCIRFYAANNHNAIICDQRANTLRCFKSLYAASTGDNKRLVLQKVLESATDHQSTGFSNQQSNSDVQSVLSLLSKIMPFTGMGRTEVHKE